MITRHIVFWAPALLLAACAVPVPDAPAPLARTPLGRDAAPPPDPLAAADSSPMSRGAVAAASAAAALAQDQDYSARGMFMQYHGDFWVRHRRYEPQVEIAFQGLQSGSTQDEAGHFDLQNYQVDARVPAPLDPDTYLLVGGFADARRYQFSSSAEAAGAFDETLWWAGPRIGFGTFVTDDSLLEVEFLPNVSTDFDDTLNSKDYQWFGNGLFTFRHSQNLFLKIGFEVSELFDDVAAYPTLGLSWLMSDSLRLDILAPRKAELAWNMSTATLLYTGFYLDGNEARVRTPVSAGKQEVDVNWQEITWRLGTIFRFNDHFSVFADGGLTVAGDYEWRSGTGANWSGTLEPSFIFRAGMGLDF